MNLHADYSLKGVAWLPSFPWSSVCMRVVLPWQSFLARLPAAGHHLLRVSIVDEGSQLAQNFSDISPHRRSDHFQRLYDAVRVYNEMAAHLSLEFMIIHSIDGPNRSR